MKKKSVLSKMFYVAKEKHKSFDEWFKELSLREKAVLKCYYDFLKNLEKQNKFMKEVK